MALYSAYTGLDYCIYDSKEGRNYVQGYALQIFAGASQKDMIDIRHMLYRHRLPRQRGRSLPDRVYHLQVTHGSVFRQSLFSKKKGEHKPLFCYKRAGMVSQGVGSQYL